MEEQQRQHSRGNCDATAAPSHSGYKFDSVAVADRGPRGRSWDFRGHNLHPPREHEGRQGAVGEWYGNRGGSSCALHGGLLLLSENLLSNGIRREINQKVRI